ncbi:disease resistance protein [Pyrus ussuriensis x Pyrus communis]|uniref:Disease resistance protein n=1 Tax=Pyrus ussuriensis x Pyrus communis TaxID=2448454 RepID=A0A5N5GTA6_9ROSA|nr:disease resistance protein [Pyrus ussuriensis x Pyrus communis]
MEATVLTSVLTSIIVPAAKKASGFLFGAARKAHKTAKMFPELHNNLSSMLKSLESRRPLIAQINQTGTNSVPETFTRTMEDGKKLVERCNKVSHGMWNMWEQRKYANKIMEWEKSLQILLPQLNSANLVAQNQIQNLITTRYAVPYLPSDTLRLDAQLAEIKMKFLTDNTPSMLVLTAPPGCGKTYMAKMLCHDQQVKAKFKDNIFFTTVSENPNIDVQQFCQHAGFRSPALENEEIAAGQNPFLLILDDVPSTSESLLHEFNQINISDSKILVTSRCHFPKFGSPYELQALSKDDALTLFCRSAFPPNTSFNEADFQEELNEIVNHCKKFPLAITTIGGSLCNQPIEKWRLKCTELSQGSILESEESLRVALQGCLDDLNKGMATVNDCFKDLGLFPKNQRIPVAALLDMWTELYEGANDNMSMVNLYELTVRNLASIVITRNKGMDGYYGERFVIQHDMLKLSFQDGGRKQQKTNKAHLVSVSTGESSSTEWHKMDLPKGEVLVLNFQAKNYALPKFMKKMCKLKVLIVTNDGFSPAELSNFELLCSLSNLKRLRLERTSIPLISKESIQSKKQKSIQSKSLKKISLFMCNVREAFGNSSIQIFETFPYLEELHIDYCNDLEKLPTKLCDLIRLKVLSITNLLRLRSCTDLKKLPGSIEKLNKLCFLDIYNCSRIKDLPESIGNRNGLRKINMAQCSRLNELPVSVNDLDQQLEKVTCDEGARNLWESVLSNLDKITVAKEEFNLNWLHRPQN